MTLVAPEVCDEARRAGAERVERRPYRRGEAGEYQLVITATDDPGVNQAVYDDAEAAGVWVNAADDPERCTAVLPSRVRRGSLLVTISTEGRSPARVATDALRRVQPRDIPHIQSSRIVLQAAGSRPRRPRPAPRRPWSAATPNPAPRSAPGSRSRRRSRFSPTRPLRCRPSREP